MQSLILFGQAAAECSKCSCPPHAIAALVGAVVVGFVIGFRCGRKGRKSVCGCRGQQKAGPRPPVRHDTRPPSEARPPIPAGSVELYVGNLSYDMTEDGLRAEFEKFGTVESVRVGTNRYNNKSKGFAFVVMPNRAEAEKAIAEMNEKEVMGRRMRVNEAQNTNKAEA